MIRSTKNIFTVAALALLCVPALRCDDTQQHEQTANESTLTCATLKNLITQADVTAFKTTYDTFMESCVPERSTIVQELATTAQEAKQKIEQELAAMGDITVKKSTLAKGVAQTFGGLFLTSMAAISCTTMYKLFFKGDKVIDEVSKIEILALFPHILVSQLLSNYCDFGTDEQLKKRIKEKYFSPIAYGKIQKSSFIIPIIIEATLGLYTLKNGIQNCNNGWNHKAYLEQQIKNLNEINAHIETQSALK